jgi:hypothetical protein
MKPTSEQTRNGVLLAVPFPEQLLTQNISPRYTASESADAVGTPHPTAVDPSSAYGCVDWYLYPDSEAKSVAA